MHGIVCNVPLNVVLHEWRRKEGTEDLWRKKLEYVTVSNRPNKKVWLMVW